MASKGWKGPRGLGPSTVVCIIGRRRQGKTLLATYWAQQAHAAGVKVFHNGPLAFGELLDFNDVMELGEKLENSLVFIDEIQTVMDSARGASLVNYLFSHSVVQLGHRKMWLMYTCQDERMLSRRLLFQTDVAVYVRTPNRGRTITFTAVQQGSILKEGSRLKGTLHRASKYWGLYDTLFIVDSAPSLMMTADRIRERAKHQDLLNLRTVLAAAAAEGLKVATAADLTIALAESFPESEIASGTVARMLNQMGLSQQRKGSERGYLLDPAAFE